MRLLVLFLALGFSSALAAEESAFGAKLQRALEVAPVGSCDRCGRTAYSPSSGENCRVNVEHKGRRASGCLECILDAIAAPVTSCAR